MTSLFTEGAKRHLDMEIGLNKIFSTRITVTTDSGDCVELHVLMNYSGLFWLI